MDGNTQVGIERHTDKDMHVSTCTRMDTQSCAQLLVHTSTDRHTNTERHKDIHGNTCRKKKLTTRLKKKTVKHSRGSYMCLKRHF